jgi:hypothetical protein
VVVQTNREGVFFSEKNANPPEDYYPRNQKIGWVLDTKNLSRRRKEAQQTVKREPYFRLTGLKTRDGSRERNGQVSTTQDDHDLETPSSSIMALDNIYIYNTINSESFVNEWKLNTEGPVPTNDREEKIENPLCCGKDR